MRKKYVVQLALYEPVGCFVSVEDCDFKSVLSPLLANKSYEKKRSNSGGTSPLSSVWDAVSERLKEIIQLAIAYALSRYFSKTREALKKEIARYCEESAVGTQALSAAYQRFIKGRLVNSAYKGVIAATTVLTGLKVGYLIWGDEIKTTSLR